MMLKYEPTGKPRLGSSFKRLLPEAAKGL